MSTTQTPHSIAPLNSCVDNIGQQGYDGTVYAPDVLPLPATVVVQSVILLLLPANATVTVTAFLQQMLQIAGEKICYSRSSFYCIKQKQKNRVLYLAIYQIIEFSFVNKPQQVRGDIAT
jgi:hypothetical protein